MTWREDCKEEAWDPFDPAKAVKLQLQAEMGFGSAGHSTAVTDAPVVQGEQGHTEADDTDPPHV